MQSREEVIQLIKKVINLTKSSSENEAAVAGNNINLTPIKKISGGTHGHSLRSS